MICTRGCQSHYFQAHDDDVADAIDDINRSRQDSQVRPACLLRFGFNLLLFGFNLLRFGFLLLLFGVNRRHDFAAGGGKEAAAASQAAAAAATQRRCCAGACVSIWRL